MDSIYSDIREESSRSSHPISWYLQMFVVGMDDNCQHPQRGYWYRLKLSMLCVPSWLCLPVNDLNIESIKKNADS